MQCLRLPNLFLFAVMVIGLAMPNSVFAQRPVAYPVDEAKNDLSFLKFRNTFTNLVIAKDVEGVVANTCPDIKLSFGSAQGHDNLRQNLVRAEGSAEYWDELLEVLLLGGRFSREGEFWAPYTWDAKVPETFNPFDTYFVLGSNVLVRSKPSKDATAIDSLNYNIVTVSLPEWKKMGYDHVYLPINQPNGTVGYVHHGYLRNWVDYRAQFLKDDKGQWKMCVFIAGD